MSNDSRIQDRFTNNRRARYTMANKDLTCLFEVMRSGMWHAVAKMTDGRTFSGTYTNESEARADMAQLSKHRLEFVKDAPSNARTALSDINQNPSREEAKEMSLADLRRVAIPSLKKALPQSETPSERQFILPESTMTVVYDSIVKAWCIENQDKILVTPYNLMVLVKTLKDYAEDRGQFVLDVDSIAGAVVFLHSQNMLMTGEWNQRVAPYRAFSDIEKQAVETIVAETQAECDRRAKMPLAELQKLVQEENPNLKLSGGVNPKLIPGVSGTKSNTETVNPLPSQRARDEALAPARKLSDSELLVIEKQRQADARKTREGR